MRVLGLAVVVLVACAGPGHGGAGIPTGHAFELGRGARRDYKRAAELYASECHGGRGAIASCDSWYRLNERLGIDVRDQDAGLVQVLCERGARFYCFAAVLRGIPPTHAIAERLAEAARGCQTNDQAACAALAAREDRDGEVDRLREVGVDVAQTPAQCAAGDVAACRIALAVYGLVSVTVSHRNDKEKAVEASACAAGLLDACAEVLGEALGGCYRLHAARSTCLDAMAARDGDASVAGPRRALRQLTAACDAGDLDACRTVPGRTVAFCELCAAGDAAACRGTVTIGGSCREVDRDARRAVTGFKDRVCACRDAACAQTVTLEMAAWSSALIMVEPEADPSPDPAISAAAAQLAACQQKLAR